MANGVLENARCFCLALLPLRAEKPRPHHFRPAQKLMKTKNINEAQFMSVLQKVLPKTTQDPRLADEIYAEITKEVNLLKNIASFEKFCEKDGIPNTEASTMKEFRTELAAKFGGENIELTPEEDGKSVAVEIALPDRTISSKVKVDPKVLEEEVKVPFVAFPVVLPSDPELVWVLGRREDLGPDEAVRALNNIAEEFWATKKGQQLQREGAEKTFAEFITYVPASALGDSGLRRHYKGPETLKEMHLLPDAEAPKQPKAEEELEEEPAF